jgi:hypothetical protein
MSWVGVPSPAFLVHEHQKLSFEDFDDPAVPDLRRG